MIEQLSAGEFANVASEWDAIDPGGNLFSSHAWIRVWLEHYGTDEHVLLLHREEGVLQAGVLFHASRGTYDQDFAETPWPWIAARPGAVNPYAPFFEFLQHDRGVHKVSIVHAPAEIRTELASIPGYTCLASFARNSRAIEIPDSFAEYERALKKRVRHNLHRNDRHMHADMPSGTLVRQHNPDVGFSAIEAIEEDSWKEQEHTAIISSQRDREFYRDLLAIDREGFSPRVYTIDTDDGSIAYILCILYGGVLYALKTSYRETYEKLSPGSVLHFWALKEICTDEPEIRRVELLGNDSPRKRHLSNRNRELFDVLMLKNTLRNRAYVFLWTRVRPAVKGHRVVGPLYAKLRERLRRGAE